MDFHSNDQFDVFNIPASSIFFSAAVPAPIGPGVEVPVTIPSIPAAEYYGIVVGQSATGVINDMLPLYSSIWISTPSISGFSGTSEARDQFPVYDTSKKWPFNSVPSPGHTTILAYLFPPGANIIGYRFSFS